MSAVISTYTTYGDIRALLGASIDEVPDSVLSLTVYKHGLELALEEVEGVLSPDTETRNLAEHYVYISALISPTDAQIKLKEIIEIYATYVVADLAADSASMSMPKIQTDGKSSLTRFSAQDTYNSVRVNIKNGLVKYLGLINTSLSLSVSSAEFLKVVEPAIDVVTGEAPA